MNLEARRFVRSSRAKGHRPIAPPSTTLRTVYRKHWVVYAKPALGGPLQVLRYLGRYTHRVAISNHRLLAFDGERVTFRWGNSRTAMGLFDPLGGTMRATRTEPGIGASENVPSFASQP